MPCRSRIGRQLVKLLHAMVCTSIRFIPRRIRLRSQRILTWVTVAIRRSKHLSRYARQDEAVTVRCWVSNVSLRSGSVATLFLRAHLIFRSSGGVGRSSLLFQFTLATIMTPIAPLCGIVGSYLLFWVSGVYRFQM